MAKKKKKEDDASMTLNIGGKKKTIKLTKKDLRALKGGFRLRKPSMNTGGSTTSM